jgi:hypothetical protein
MANLANAQLMEPPEGSGPAFVGAVKQGTGITLDNATGTVNANLTTFCSKIIAGTDIQILPTTGIGTVVISSTIRIDPNSYLPIGTIMTFFQTGAPPRWITESPGTRMIRINGPGGGQGGSADWNSVFTTQTFSGSVSTSGASISGNTDTVNQTPSGSVSVGGVSLGATSLSAAQIPGHGHQYARHPAGGNKQGNTGGIQDIDFNVTTGATGGGGAHSHSLSVSGSSFSGNNLSHSHSVSGGLSGSGSFSGGSFDFNVQYIDVIVCRKLSNPG